MANKPISGLAASVANLTGTDVLPVVQTTGVGPVKMSGQQLAGGLLGSTTFSGATITANAPVIDLTQTWNNAAVTFTGAKLNVTDTASNAASLLMDLQVGGSSRFNVDKNGVATLASSLAVVNGNITTANGYSIQATGTSANIWARNDTASFIIGTSADTFLTRKGAANLRLGVADAAAPVAQTLAVQGVVAGTTNTAGADFALDGSQSTGNAHGGRIVFRASVAGSSGTLQNGLSRIADVGSQVVSGGSAGRFFSVYDTFTDTSNFSRVRMGFNVNASYFECVSESAGTGSLRALNFGVAGFQNIYFQTNSAFRLFVDYNGNLGAGGISVGDNTYDWGKTIYGNNRPRDLYVGRNFFLGAYQEMTEMTAPAAPAANSVRIYAVDNGSGKTQLMALFATGAAQQIAIEP